MLDVSNPVDGCSLTGIRSHHSRFLSAKQARQIRNANPDNPRSLRGFRLTSRLPGS
jgi:hypothetical protein